MATHVAEDGTKYKSVNINLRLTEREIDLLKKYAAAMSQEKEEKQTWRDMLPKLIYDQFEFFEEMLESIGVNPD